VFQSICENHMTWILNVTGTRLRNALMAAIYRKCLRLSNSAMQSESTGKVRTRNCLCPAPALGPPGPASRLALLESATPPPQHQSCRVGSLADAPHLQPPPHTRTHLPLRRLQVVTLMSNDAQKVQDAMLSIHTIWGSPILIAAILALLYQQVGWATFVGLGVMLLLVPLSGVIISELLARAVAAPARRCESTAPGDGCPARDVCTRPDLHFVALDGFERRCTVMGRSAQWPWCNRALPTGRARCAAAAAACSCNPMSPTPPGTPLHLPPAVKLAGFRRELLKWTDKRVGLMGGGSQSCSMLVCRRPPRAFCH
jgi:hypothetical protein